MNIRKIILTVKKINTNILKLFLPKDFASNFHENILRLGKNNFKCDHKNYYWNFNK